MDRDAAHLQECGNCGSTNLVGTGETPGYWRKRCLDCGSLGPFLLVAGCADPNGPK